MNELKITPRLFQSSEIQLFQMICFKITWMQTNKDCKEEFVDVLCFLNMTSAVGHKILDYLQSTFHIFLFSPVLLEVLIRTSNSKNVLFIQSRFTIIISSKCETYKIHMTRTKLCNFYKKVLARTLANFLCFQHYKWHLKTSSH